LSRKEDLHFWVEKEKSSFWSFFVGLLVSNAKRKKERESKSAKRLELGWFLGCSFCDFWRFNLCFWERFRWFWILRQKNERIFDFWDKKPKYIWFLRQKMSVYLICETKWVIFEFLIIKHDFNISKTTILKFIN
jgi:hypothetical protein